MTPVLLFKNLQFMSTGAAAHKRS